MNSETLTAPTVAPPSAAAVQAFEEGPQRLRAAVAGLTPEELRAHPIPDKWSIQEIAFHLVDAELMGAVRTKRAFTQPGSTLKPFDQDAWVRDFAYNDRPAEQLADSFQLFEGLRKDSMHLFRQAGSEDWGRWVDHPEYGRLTLARILELYAQHSERHIGQILERRRLLGRPLSMPLLLSQY